MQNLGDGWTTTYLENHDQARSVTRYASDAPEHRVNASKMLATYVLSLTGTPLVYQGQVSYLLLLFFSVALSPAYSCLCIPRG